MEGLRDTNATWAEGWDELASKGSDCPRGTVAYTEANGILLRFHGAVWSTTMRASSAGDTATGKRLYGRCDEGRYIVLDEAFVDGILAVGEDGTAHGMAARAKRLLISNFRSESEARRAMGSAMFSRISTCVAFDDLSEGEKATIAKHHYERILGRLDEEDAQTIEQSDILEWFTRRASRYNNMRTMKNKVEKAIFGKLSVPIFEASNLSDPRE